MRFFSTFTGIGGFEVGIHNAWRAHVSSLGGGQEIETGDVKEDGKRLHTLSSERGVSAGGRSYEYLNPSSDQGQPSGDVSVSPRDEQGRVQGSTERTVSDDLSIFSQQPTCVGYSEIDKYAADVYSNHYPGAKNYGDITKINAEELPDFDCLVGGFPCQAFSIAGKRRGFEDTRGTLFFDLARILRAKRPRLFVFENVKGLLSHDGGNTFKTIISAIDELGYDCQWQVVNSKNFGVPQNRERIIIVGHLRGTSRPEVFPIGGDTGETVNPATGKGTIVDLSFRADGGYKVRKDERAGTLDANYYKGIANQERPGVIVGTLRTHKDGNGFREVKSGVSPTIPARAREDGSGQPVIIAQRGRYVEDGSTDQTAEQRPDGNTNSITTVQKDNLLYDNVKIRRLTPIECERLQAFPDDWTKWGLNDLLKPISDTQRYKMCGNAVTTNVIQAIFERIFATCI